MSSAAREILLPQSGRRSAPSGVTVLRSSFARNRTNPKFENRRNKRSRKRKIAKFVSLDRPRSSDFSAKKSENRGGGHRFPERDWWRVARVGAAFLRIAVSPAIASLAVGIPARLRHFPRRAPASRSVRPPRARYHIRARKAAVGGSPSERRKDTESGGVARRARPDIRVISTYADPSTPPYPKGGAYGGVYREFPDREIGDPKRLSKRRRAVRYQKSAVWPWGRGGLRRHRESGPGGRFSSATRLANQTPAPRGAVKVRDQRPRSGLTLTASTAMAGGGFDADGPTPGRHDGLN